jgi:hypothetical protein
MGSPATVLSEIIARPSRRELWQHKERAKEEKN